MSSTGMTGPLLRTQALHRALQGAASDAFVADMLLLEAWEADRSMDLGIMLRVRQIRRANQYLSTEIAAELTNVSKGHPGGSPIAGG